MNWFKKNLGWITVTIVGILPLIGVFQMINLDLSGTSGPWISMDSFTMPGRHPGEPSREVSGAHIAVKETGEWAIRWLVGVLTLTPLTILTGIKSRLHVRQAFGISAFVYALLHFLFFCVDKGWMETFEETGYILGLISAVVMLALALTSNRKAMKKLRELWKKLHKLAYLAGVLAVVHLTLLEHADWAPYAIILVIGFVLRISTIKEWVIKLRSKKTPVLAN